MTPFQQSDTVAVTFYGVRRIGTVTNNQTSAIVFLRFHGETRVRWFHATSLEVVL